MLEKVAVVGAGNVGATAAQRVAEKSLARTVVMIDVIEGVPQGKGLDQYQSGPIEGFDTRIIGTQGYDEAAGAEGFTRMQLHATLAGLPLYRAYGFEAVEEVLIDSGGVPIPCVHMTKRIGVSSPGSPAPTSAAPPIIHETP